MNCRVISTYFGPRRNHGGRNKTILNCRDAIALIKDAVKLEMEKSSGVKKDTIIVNHDFGNDEGNEYLNSIDGLKTLDGEIKILHRPFDKGIGGSFCSFNYAFEKFKDEYEYWHFNEDDYYLIHEGYFKLLIEQLERDPKVAYVCTYREDQFIENGYISETGNNYKAHAHGGAGGTHVKFLNEAYNKFGRLPFSTVKMNDAMINSIKDGNLDAFDSSYARRWYREFELQGEIEFTNVYKHLGYELQNFDCDVPILYSVRDKMYY